MKDVQPDSIDAIAADPSIASDLTAAQRCTIARRCAAVILLVGRVEHELQPAVADQLVDAKEAGPRLKMHPQTLRRWLECPFLVIRGRRKLYSLTGMER